MQYAPLDFPPGVSRPGTVYKAKGRFYETQLVRWFDGVLQAVGGWSPLLRTAPTDVAAAISDDGGTFVNETADANNATVGDVVLTPAVPVVNDAFYVGFRFRFQELDLVVSTAGVGGTLAWEYWNGAAWAALPGLDDTTSGFTAAAGAYTVSWALPTNWAKNTVNLQGPFYYIRARVATAGTSGAVGTSADIGTGPVALDAPVRGVHAWQTNAGGPRVALGTHEALFLVGQGTLDDITPTGFVGGNADAVQASAAYNFGAYGVGLYGVGDDAQDVLTPAHIWQMDNYGEDLVAVSPTDRRIHYYDSGAGGIAAPLTGAPNARGVVVTPEGFIVALGAAPIGDSVTNPRLIRWADQDNINDWAPSASTTAGDHTLRTTGEIVAGARGRGETLIWTTTGFHSLQYIGGSFVYTARELDMNCGLIAPRAYAVAGGRAVWMGHRGFFFYDGVVQPIPTEVSDYVFDSLNRTQVSKVHAEVRSAFNEVWFYYPSGGATECDRYVVYNYKDGFMYIGDLARTSGVDQGVFPNPISAAPDGFVYQHEAGTAYLNADGSSMNPYAETGPIEVGAGDQILEATAMIPDENTLGAVEITLFASMYPSEAEVEHGPFTPRNPTDVRVSARQVRVRIDQVAPGWRFGTLRLGAIAGGGR